jgi:hypothetical protein
MMKRCIAKLSIPIIFGSVLTGCVPPLEDECFSKKMDAWDSAEILLKEGKSYKFVFIKSDNELLGEQFYPDTEEGKTLYESFAYKSCMLEQ